MLKIPELTDEEKTAAKEQRAKLAAERKNQRVGGHTQSPSFELDLLSTCLSNNELVSEPYS